MRAPSRPFFTTETAEPRRRVPRRPGPLSEFMAFVREVNDAGRCGRE